MGGYFMTVEDKATAILQATLELVAEHGFHGTAMSKIAQRSCVSAGIIYHYFENKDDLMQALYVNIKQRFAEAMITEEVLHLPYPDYLLKAWQNAYQFYIEHPLVTRYIEQFENSPYYATIDLSAIEQNFNPLMTRIYADMQNGLIKNMPHWVIYDLTLGVALNVAKHVLVGLLQPNDKLLLEIAQSCHAAIAKGTLLG